MSDARKTRVTGRSEWRIIYIFSFTSFQNYFNRIERMWTFRVSKNMFNVDKVEAILAWVSAIYVRIPDASY